MVNQKLIEENARIIAHSQAYNTLFFIELEAPEISKELLPGQFVHMQIPGLPDHILRRPFSVYKTNPIQGTLTILYQVVGAGTKALTEASIDMQASLIGPIGNTWHVPDTVSSLLVAGGVGAAPLYMLAQKLSSANNGSKVILGAQTKEALVCFDDYFVLQGLDIVPATDDGSFGFNGFCTLPAQEAINSGFYSYVAVCGPEPVLKIVSGMAREAGLACEVSLERRMACGVGACLSCVVDTTMGKKRCCVDGPIFNAAEVVW